MKGYVSEKSKKMWETAGTTQVLWGKASERHGFSWHGVWRLSGNGGEGVCLGNVYLRGVSRSSSGRWLVHVELWNCRGSPSEVKEDDLADRSISTL